MDYRPTVDSRDITDLLAGKTKRGRRCAYVNQPIECWSKAWTWWASMIAPGKYKLSSASLVVCRNSDIQLWKSVDTVWGELVYKMMRLLYISAITALILKVTTIISNITPEAHFYCKWTSQECHPHGFHKNNEMHAARRQQSKTQNQNENVVKFSPVIINDYIWYHMITYDIIWFTYEIIWYYLYCDVWELLYLLSVFMILSPYFSHLLLLWYRRNLNTTLLS